MIEASILFHWSICLFYASIILFSLLLFSSLKSGNAIPPSLFFFRKIVSTIRSLLWYIQILGLFVLFLWEKKKTRILIGITFNVDCLGNMDILTLFIILIHECVMLLHLFVPFSVSFIIALQFSLYRSFTSLIKFITNYLIPFDAFINGIYSYFLFQMIHC